MEILLKEMSIFEIIRQHEDTYSSSSSNGGYIATWDNLILVHRHVCFID